MARRTSLEPHWRVLKGERSTFIAMARETAGFVCCKGLGHSGPYAAVRIVAIDARHRAFRHTVVIWLLKLCHDIDVAFAALLVDCGELPCHQSEWAVGVNLVAYRALHLI
jgi:hypothetical protein